jgi:hypothetical protein
VARTGEVPESFVLFALGFLLIFLAHILIVLPLRRLPVGAGWVLPLVALAGGVATLRPTSILPVEFRPSTTLACSSSKAPGLRSESSSYVALIRATHGANTVSSW